MMHGTFNIATMQTIPAFLTKLKMLVDDEDTNHLIYWDPCGRSFHICDGNRLAKELLPLYFKHNNLSSFIRQLNMYGFRKVNRVDSVFNFKLDTEDMEFSHPYFIRNKESLLSKIQRKTSNNIGLPVVGAKNNFFVPSLLQSRALDANSVVNTLSNRVITTKDFWRLVETVKHMRCNQESLNQQLGVLKSENQLLYRELSDLREHYDQQSQLIHTLFTFLTAFAKEGRAANLRIGLHKRKALPALAASDNNNNSNTYANKRLKLNLPNGFKFGHSSLSPSLLTPTDSTTMPNYSKFASSSSCSTPDLSDLFNADNCQLIAVDHAITNNSPLSALENTYADGMGLLDNIVDYNNDGDERTKNCQTLSTIGANVDDNNTTTTNNNSLFTFDSADNYVPISEANEEVIDESCGVSTLPAWSPSQSHTPLALFHSDDQTLNDLLTGHADATDDIMNFLNSTDLLNDDDNLALFSPNRTPHNTTPVSSNADAATRSNVATPYSDLCGVVTEDDDDNVSWQNRHFDADDSVAVVTSIGSSTGISTANSMKPMTPKSNVIVGNDPMYSAANNDPVCLLKPNRHGNKLKLNIVRSNTAILPKITPAIQPSKPETTSNNNSPLVVRLPPSTPAVAKPIALRPKGTSVIVKNNSAYKYSPLSTPPSLVPDEASTQDQPTVMHLSMPKKNPPNVVRMSNRIRNTAKTSPKAA